MERGCREGVVLGKRVDQSPIESTLRIRFPILLNTFLIHDCQNCSGQHLVHLHPSPCPSPLPPVSPTCVLVWAPLVPFGLVGPVSRCQINLSKYISYRWIYRFWCARHNCHEPKICRCPRNCMGLLNEGAGGGGGVVDRGKSLLLFTLRSRACVYIWICMFGWDVRPWKYIYETVLTMALGQNQVFFSRYIWFWGFKQIEFRQIDSCRSGTLYW